MAIRKPKSTDNPLIKVLKAMGCTFCPTCYAYMYPDHVQHVNIWLDTHETHLKLVGGYGDVRVVDLREDMPEALPEVA